MIQMYASLICQVSTFSHYLYKGGSLFPIQIEFLWVILRRYVGWGVFVVCFALLSKAKNRQDLMYLGLNESWVLSTTFSWLSFLPILWEGWNLKLPPPLFWSICGVPDVDHLTLQWCQGCHNPEYPPDPTLNQKTKAAYMYVGMINNRPDFILCISKNHKTQQTTTFIMAEDLPYGLPSGGASVSANEAPIMETVNTIDSLRPQPLIQSMQSVWGIGEAFRKGRRVRGMNSSHRPLDLL